MPISSPDLWLLLKGQASFSGCLGQSLDSTMIPVSISVETNALNSNADCLLGNRFSNYLSGFHVAGRGQPLSQQLRPRACRSKRHSRTVVNNLGIDMPGRSEHRQPRTIGKADNLLANMILAPQSRFPGLYITHIQRIPIMPHRRRMLSQPCDEPAHQRNGYLCPYTAQEALPF